MNIIWKPTPKNVQRILTLNIVMHTSTMWSEVRLARYTHMHGGNLPSFLCVVNEPQIQKRTESVSLTLVNLTDVIVPLWIPHCRSGQRSTEDLKLCTKWSLSVLIILIMCENKYTSH